MMTNRVLEKEKKIRELMRMGGLRTGTETAAAWFTIIIVAVGPIVGALFIFKVYLIRSHAIKPLFNKGCRQHKYYISAAWDMLLHCTLLPSSLSLPWLN